MSTYFNRRCIILSLALTAVVYLTCAIEQAHAEISYFLYDAPNRSVTALTNQSQDVVNKYEYTGFGNASSAVEAVSNTRRYVGEQQEPENNLIFLRARYYDPSMGRFITHDPRPGAPRNPQSINSYIYAVNNPINLTDPSGLETPWWLQTIGIGTGIVALTASTPWVAAAAGVATLGIGIYDVISTFSDPRSDRMDKAISVAGLLPDWPGVGASTIGLYRTLHTSTGGGYSYSGYSDPLGNYGWQSLSSYQRNQSRNESAVSWGNERESRYNSLSTYGPSWMKSSYGGVSLSKTAELMLNIQDVGGATFDPATGQVILYGKQNVSLPNMELDDLSVAVSSVYGLHKAAQDPGVSIGTEPSGIPGQMKVRYDGETFNTKFGLVMFDSDRLLKCLTMGKDNITSQAVTSSVPGYQNMHNMYMGVI